MDKILIIEDNKDVSLILTEMLEGEGYAVKAVLSGLDGMSEAKTDSYDLILLDMMLPYISGDEILKAVRNISEVPVIIISAKDMTGVKIDMLKLGADDYITKPFDLGEVAARVASNLRRSKKNQQKDSKLIYKDMILDTESKRVSVNGSDTELTAKEYMIIELLVLNPGKVFSKANIYETVWQEEYLGDDNSVKTHMSNLRNKLKKANPSEEYIETVWGLGYRLCRKDG